MEPHRIANRQSSLVIQPIRLNGGSENIEPIIGLVRWEALMYFMYQGHVNRTGEQYLAAWGAIYLSIIITSSFYLFDAIERYLVPRL
jgi:hypothetical protein